MIKKTCIVCKKIFRVKPYLKKRSKYCSFKCYWKFKKGKAFYSPKGKKLSETTKLKMSITRRGKPLLKLRGRKLPLVHRENISEAMKGKHINNERWNWKGGRIKTSSGYFAIINPARFEGDKRRYLREHRLVIEQYIGRILKRTEEVHHLGEKTDNRPFMLMAFINKAAHQKFERNPQNIKPEEIIFDGRRLQH